MEIQQPQVQNLLLHLPKCAYCSCHKILLCLQKSCKETLICKSCDRDYTRSIHYLHMKVEIPLLLHLDDSLKDEDYVINICAQLQQKFAKILSYKSSDVSVCMSNLVAEMKTSKLYKQFGYARIKKIMRQLADTEPDYGKVLNILSRAIENILKYGININGIFERLVYILESFREMQFVECAKYFQQQSKYYYLNKIKLKTSLDMYTSTFYVVNNQTVAQQNPRVAVVDFASVDEHLLAGLPRTINKLTVKNTAKNAHTRFYVYHMRRMLNNQRVAPNKSTLKLIFDYGLRNRIRELVLDDPLFGVNNSLSINNKLNQIALLHKMKFSRVNPKYIHELASQFL